MFPIKGKIIELNETGFVIDDGSRIVTQNNGLNLDLAVGEEVNIIGILLEGGKIYAAAISVYRSGQQIKIEDKPPFISKLTSKSDDIEANNRLDTFQSVNSIPVSVDHSKGGGTSIQSIERFSDGTRHLIVGDAFPRQPRQRKSRVLLVAAVSCISTLLALIGALLFWFILR